MPGRRSADDPLTALLRPPADETQEQREARILEEKEAKRINDEIDAQLKAERRALAAESRSRAKPVRVLLLGQSESGKSTTLKNFQMIWAPQSWKEELSSWRSVVLLNIVKSTLRIISVLWTTDESLTQGPDEPHLTMDLETLYNNLWTAQSILCRRLGADHEDPSDNKADLSTVVDPHHEFFVPSNTSWKERFIMRRKSVFDIRPSLSMTRSSKSSSTHKTDDSNGDEAMDILLSHKKDIQGLWENFEMQVLLRRRGIRLEEAPGFFMNDLDRILNLRYRPSDDDVVRARLRTIGIQEHKFIFETGTESGREWRIYDVGGSRPQRASWFSFFENIDAIIFLAPVNCFDEVLDEDHDVNRLQDSFDLWRDICRSPLLAKVQLILFLNKVDLLDRKLKSGIRFARYVPAFGDRQNTLDTVCHYLRNQFKEIHKRYSPQERPFNAWLTCATDTKATEKTLGTVRHGIIKEQFSKAFIQ